MSRNRKRTNGRTGQQLAAAANRGQLGHEQPRSRKIDRALPGFRAPEPPVVQPRCESTAGLDGEPIDVAVARILSRAHPGGCIPRAELRDACTGHARHRPSGRSGGQSGSYGVQRALLKFERAGWVRRDLLTDSVLVLDPVALAAHLAARERSRRGEQLSDEQISILGRQARHAEAAS